MKRLTQRTAAGIDIVYQHYSEEKRMCYGCPKHSGCVKDLLTRLAYYEDLEEQGRFVVLPCKVGDELFRIVKPTNSVYKPFVPLIPDKAEPCGIYYKGLMGEYRYIPFDDFGKTVFLTREEAENALNAMMEGKP